MDLLSHICTGFVAGSVIANFSTKSKGRKLGIIGLGALAGAIPDLDVITIWSGFDATFGKWFALEQSGRELYFQKHWYSHHGAMHSIFSAFFFPLFFLFLRSVVLSSYKDVFSDFAKRLSRNRDFIVSFGLGYTGHLVGDLLTPGLSWGGVNLLFPYPEYYGGWEKIWWWNNYDLFLILFGIGFSNSCLLLFGKPKLFRWVSIVVLLFGALLFAIQVEQRGEPFVHGKGGAYQNQEQRSKELQKEILGESCYKLMQKFDRLIPFPF